MVSTSDNSPSYEDSNLDMLLRQKDEQIETLSKRIDTLQIYQKEMHHRIKNQLSTIITLFRLQKRYSTNDEFNLLINDCESRVLSIAFVHDQLYQMVQGKSCSCQYYIDRILKEMRNIYQFEDKKIDVSTSIDETNISTNYMLPCGLIITELITNSCKYAFPASWQGTPQIKIVIKYENGFHCIKVCDNGVGFEKSESKSDSQSLGIQIITMLVEHQLHGSIQVDTSNGTCVQIKFKDK